MFIVKNELIGVIYIDDIDTSLIVEKDKILAKEKSYVGDHELICIGAIKEDNLYVKINMSVNKIKNSFGNYLRWYTNDKETYDKYVRSENFYPLICVGYVSIKDLKKIKLLKNNSETLIREYSKICIKTCDENVTENFKEETKSEIYFKEEFKKTHQNDEEELQEDKTVKTLAEELTDIKNEVDRKLKYDTTLKDIFCELVKGINKILKEKAYNGSDRAIIKLSDVTSYTDLLPSVITVKSILMTKLKRDLCDYYRSEGLICISLPSSSSKENDLLLLSWKPCNKIDVDEINKINNIVDVDDEIFDLMFDTNSSEDLFDDEYFDNEYLEKNYINDTFDIDSSNFFDNKNVDNKFNNKFNDKDSDIE